jgi:hypothetical protein
MTKKILMGICILLAAITTNAQMFKLGVKAGANVGKINGSSFQDKFEYGYHVGGFFQIKISPKLSIQPEVLLSQINTTVDSSFKSLYTSLYNPGYVKNIQLKYLTIPLVLNYKLAPFISLQGGAQYAILMDNNKNLLQNGQQAFKNGDFSLLGGVQFNLGKFLLGGRYLVGLNNINDIDNKDKWKNQSAQISLGFRL